MGGITYEGPKNEKVSKSKNAVFSGVTRYLRV